MTVQNIALPLRDNKIGETPWLTEETVLKPLLKKHMAPKGKVGLLVVKEGSVDFVWEDSLDDVLTCDKNHPIVIEPERYHHVILTGPAVFRVEFYKDVDTISSDKEAVRPGEAFLTK